MKRITLLISFVVIAITSGAQPEGFRPEKLDDETLIKMQTKDIVYWLDLEGEIKDKFVAEYTAFRKEIDAVAKKITPPAKNGNEEQIDKTLLQNFEIGEQILQIRKKYYLRFKTFMKPSQIQMVYFIENEAGRRFHKGPGPDGPHGPMGCPTPPCPR